MNLETPLVELDWLPAQRVRLLERFGLQSVGDLLTHFPKRYEDRRQFDRFPQDESDQPVCLCGTVKKTAVKRFGGWKKMFEVVIEDDVLGSTVACRWFNVHFVEKMIATGHRLVVFGKPKLRAKTVCFDHPEFEVVENDDDISIHLKRITPVHRATEGLSTRVLRSTMFRVLEKLDACEIGNLLPVELDDFPTGEALRQIHFPDNDETLARARRHLVLAEFFALQMFIAAKRAETVSLPGLAHSGPGALLEEFHRRLPFPLTGAQVRTITEIRADLASNRPMNRLLHGDVGSGKTIVALSAMLLAAEAGFQSALMAPTQILAEQHYVNFKSWLEPLGIRLALRTGARREESGPLELWTDRNAVTAESSSRQNAATSESETRATRSSDPRAGGDVSVRFSDLQRPGSAGLRPAGDGILPSRTLLPTPFRGATSFKRRLPHFEKPWAIYAVSFSTVKRRCLLPEARFLALEAVAHFHNVRYELFAACVMPDHVHLLLQPWPKEADGGAFWPLGELLKSVKSFSAREINKSLGTTGAVWEAERFDRYIRSEADLAEKFNYILRNPWDSGVARMGEDYPWIWTQDLAAHAPQSPSRQNAATSGSETRATQAARTRVDANPQIIVGTHALLYEEGAWPDLGLIVIDEQHKFGVMQRAKLIAQGTAPDVLVMTATPIPRTLTMTVYGDLDVSTIDELPANRGKIITALRENTKLPDAVDFLRQQLEAGRQAYIVYPLIDESAKTDAKAAAEEFKKWQTLLAPMTCELLHGRVESEQKEAIMARFRRGETKALIATSVIEVGIDVPNANLMLIENAERFGLAQLHQLRGRIGRGEHKSYCILLSSAKNEEALEKLQTLVRTGDGFEIAEADLRLRGGGDILGTAQSGLPPLKLGDLLADAELMRLARQTAKAIFGRDPELAEPEHQGFRRLIAERKKLLLSQVS